MIRLSVLVLQISGYGTAAKLFTKVDEAGLSRMALKQKGAVKARMDLNCRDADRMVKRVKTLTSSTEVCATPISPHPPLFEVMVDLD